MARPSAITKSSKSSAKAAWENDVVPLENMLALYRSVSEPFLKRCISYTTQLKSLVNRFERILWSKKGYEFIVRDWSSLPDIKICSNVLQTMRFSRNLQPIELEGLEAKRIVVIAPHPDDELLGAWRQRVTNLFQAPL